MTTIDNSNNGNNSNDNNLSSTTAASSGTMPTTERAQYDAMLPLARALKDEEVMQMNLDPAAICPIIVAIAERMESQRSMFEGLSHFDMTNLDTLRSSATALSYSHSAFQIATTPPDALPEIAQRGQTILKAFQAFVPSLSYLNLIDATRFDSLRSPVGYRDLVIALEAYAIAFREGDLEQMKQKSPLTDALLAETDMICQQLRAVVGHRAVDPAKVAEIADIRARMFTLCVKRYDQLRRAASYLRWEQGDSETLVPSLYNSGRRKAEPKADVVKPVVAAPVDAPVTPAAPASPAVHGAPSAPVAAPGATSHEVGMPGGSPFGTG